MYTLAADELHDGCCLVSGSSSGTVDVELVRGRSCAEMGRPWPAAALRTLTCILILGILAVAYLFVTACFLRSRPVYSTRSACVIQLGSTGRDSLIVGSHVQTGVTHSRVVAGVRNPCSGGWW